MVRPINCGEGAQVYVRRGVHEAHRTFYYSHDRDGAYERWLEMKRHRERDRERERRLHYEPAPPPPPQH